jgi:two-component system chemotaxis sensor kinase CheA
MAADVRMIMKAGESDFKERLIIIFKREAVEHLNALSELLAALEYPALGKERTRIIGNLIRETHSLKGAARSVEILEIASLCQSMEYVLIKLNQDEIDISPNFFVVLRQTIEHLANAVDSVKITENVSNPNQLHVMLRELLVKKDQ